MHFFIKYLIVFDKRSNLSCLQGKNRSTFDKPVDFCGESKLMLLVLLENESDIFFPPKRSPVLINNDEVNVASIPLNNELNLFSFMLNIFSLFRASSCLLSLIEFQSVQVVIIKAERSSKHYFDETFFLKQLY